MKFSQVAAFENHLRGSQPNFLSRMYLFVMPDDVQRKSFFLKTMRLFPLDALRLDVRGHRFEEIVEELSLLAFASPKLMIDHVELLSKEEIERLAKLAERLPKERILFLGSASSKNLEPLFALTKKQLVALDLSQEKIWEREKRLKAEVVAMAAYAKKRMHPKALNQLFSRVGPEFSLLQQELFKLVSYVGTREEIEESDVHLLVADSQERNAWNMAEEILWQNRYVVMDSSDEASKVFGLIPALRTQMRWGLLLAEGGVLASEVKPYFKEKYEERAKRFGRHFFIEGQGALFALELAAKNQGGTMPALWDCFIGRIHESRTCITAQPTW